MEDDSSPPSDETSRVVLTSTKRVPVVLGYLLIPTVKLERNFLRPSNFFWDSKVTQRKTCEKGVLREVL